MRRLLPTLLPTLLVMSAAVRSVSATEPGVDFFERKIRPVLVEHCYECHSAVAKQIKGKLRLDSRPGMRRGGESGRSVVPGNPGQSLLLKALRHESLEMPPKGKLPAAVIGDFETWIRQGAADPRDRPPTAGEVERLSWQVLLAARKDWWSLKPVRATTPPEVRNADWSMQPIDRFVLARLEDKQLQPAPQADPRTLVRRLSLTLTGLPPRPADVTAFVTSFERDPESAWVELVDRTLASPHFGERWARHWMDVVRFSETHGNEWNYEVHYAWRYRDYLVRAFNQDVPYDQLVREHIAGDLLESPRINQQGRFYESPIGTAFYRFGEVNHDDCIALRSIGYDILANQLDTLTKAFQASTVACARCHDHKIDAFSTRDYHALLGVLRSTRLVAIPLDLPDINERPHVTLHNLKVQIRKGLARLWANADTPHLELLMLAAEMPGGEDKTTQHKGLDAKLLARWKTALSVKNPPLEHPLHTWRSIVDRDENTPIAGAWIKLSDKYLDQRRRRKRFNLQNYRTLFDFRDQDSDHILEWTAYGEGLVDPHANAGDLALSGSGDSIVSHLLPAGIHSHLLTARLGGSFRSPILHTTRKHLSLQVLGNERAVVRIVSNNCQLNYVNYKVLQSDTPTWITFEPAADNQKLRAYIELVTKFYNPKFPDQLATIGGAKENDRVPWDQVADDPRSYFGITRVMVHDVDEAPRAELDHLCRLFEDEQVPGTLRDVAIRYAAVIDRAVRAWANDNASPAQVRWVDWMIRNGLLANSIDADPQLAQLVKQYRTIAAEHLVPARIIAGVEDVDDGIDQPVLVRGNPTEFGDPVPRRFLEVLGGTKQRFRHGSGRRELADQIASPDNPLTARVMVNRIWHHLFGAGLVRTVDDFGRLGERPSHPKLLDHLASSLVDDDWSLKRMIRRVVLSRTFRMSARRLSGSTSIDPLNRLLRHYPARRLDAESIRDAVLATSGRLDLKLGGPSIYPFREQPNADRRLFVGPLDGHGRRSLYIKTNLMEPTRFLSVFNTPGGKVVEGRRDFSNVPAQALAMLNDPFVIGQAKAWGEQLVAGSHGDPSRRIDAMFQLALSRPASDSERLQFEQLLDRLAILHTVPATDRMTSQKIWKDMAHVVFNLKEFIYLP